MNRRSAVGLAITTAAALAAAAPVGAQVAGPGATSATPAVAINDAGYAPADIVVAPGGHVVWTNGGANPHTVTSDTGLFDSGTLNKNATFDLAAPAVTGTYAYHCTFHAFMHGTVVVSTLTLQGPKKAVLLGKPATVQGAVPGGAAGTPVTVESYAAGVWTPVATTALAADGTFRSSVTGLKANASLRAHVGADVSPSVEVLLSPKVTLKRTGKRELSVTVTPKKAGTAKLQKLNTDTFRWKSLRTVRITAAGKAKVTVPKAGGVFRIEVAATKTLAAGDSPSLTFR